MPATRPVVRSTEPVSTRYRKWMAALDQLGLPLILFDAEGQAIHRTTAFATILAHEPPPFRMQVFAVARQIADAHCAGSSADAAHHGVQLIANAASSAEARFRRTRCYSVRALFLEEPGSARAAPGPLHLLVALERRKAALPPADLLRAQFGLTRREADVALLLAQRMHNTEIAQALCISVHTARHHTAHVLEKLNIHRRVEVARLVQNIHSVSPG